MGKPIYIFSSGEIHRKDNTILHISGDKKNYIPVENISEIYIFGEETLNTTLLSFVAKHEIPLHFFNYYGYYSGTFYPRETHVPGDIIVKQVLLYQNQAKRLELAKKIEWGSFENMYHILKYYSNRGEDLSAEASSIQNFEEKIWNADNIDDLMLIEAQARKSYYSSFDKIINLKGFEFEKRTKRPPLNPLNALISFGNSILYSVVLSEIYRTHLFPQIGILHSTNTRRNTLNLDIAEIFKPIIVDRSILSVLNKGQLEPGDFQSNVSQTFLSEEGRKIIVSSIEEHLNSTFHYAKMKRNVSYREMIRLEAYKIEKHILENSEYEPFISRW